MRHAVHGGLLVKGLVFCLGVSLARAESAKLTLHGDDGTSCELTVVAGALHTTCPVVHTAPPPTTPPPLAPPPLPPPATPLLGAFWNPWCVGISHPSIESGADGSMPDGWQRYHTGSSQKTSSVAHRGSSALRFPDVNAYVEHREYFRMVTALPYRVDLWGYGTAGDTGVRTEVLTKNCGSPISCGDQAALGTMSSVVHPADADAEASPVDGSAFAARHPLAVENVWERLSQVVIPSATSDKVLTNYGGWPTIIDDVCYFRPTCLLPDASFERGSDGTVPSGWQQYSGSHPTKTSLVARSGSSSIQFTSSGQYLEHNDWLSVRSGLRYTLTLWLYGPIGYKVRTEVLVKSCSSPSSCGAQAALRTYKPTTDAKSFVDYHEVTEANVWQRFTHVVYPSQTHSKVLVNIGGPAVVSASTPGYLDDVCWAEPAHCMMEHGDFESGSAGSVPTGWQQYGGKACTHSVSVHHESGASLQCTHQAYVEHSCASARTSAPLRAHMLHAGVPDA